MQIRRKVHSSSSRVSLEQREKESRESSSEIIPRHESERDNRADSITCLPENEILRHASDTGANVLARFGRVTAISRFRSDLSGIFPEFR